MAYKHHYTFKSSWALVFLRAIDLFFACCIWRNYNIMISSWCGLEMRKPNPKRWAVVLNRMLNKIDPDHCEKSITADIERNEVALKVLRGEV